MKNRLLALVLTLLLTIGFIGGCGPNNNNLDEPIDSEIKEEVVIDTPEPTGVYNPLTGMHVEATGNLIAVMMDNLAPARPQSGLIKADIVYEIEAEGLITRLMALFHGDPPEFVGPIRSARPYYMQLAKEWDAYYAHVGGSDDAFAKAVEWKIRDIDDVRGHRGFFLDKQRQRPHNTYLNFTEALKGKEENGKFKDWVFVDIPEIEPSYTEISFSYTRTNNVTYKWDKDKEIYLRFINDKVHDDRESGVQIFTNNIVIQYANHRSLQTELQHIWVDVVGNGKAEYFLGGQYYQGTWEKKSMTDPTIYYNDKGEQVSFVKGKTWIQVVRPNAEITKIY